MISRKAVTHVVFKIADAEKYLDDDEKQLLGFLLNKICKGREADGKVPSNEYVICNKDEPYAAMVLRAVLDGEEKKVNA